MKKIKIFVFAVLASVTAIQCNVEGINDDLSALSTVSNANLDKIFDISTDNSGNVKITPLGVGFSKAEVHFGTGTGADASAVVTPGKSVIHQYAEGNYTVTVDYYDLAGNVKTETYPLQVLFSAPTELAINTSISGKTVTVTPQATNANGYMVYFGDVANETGTPVANSASATHTYAAAGVYTVRVVALSGGAATTVGTTSVTIFDAYQLPITYESPIQNYGIGGTFGGVGTAVVDNPFPGGINTSAKVWQYTKAVGAASWSGTWTPLAPPDAVPINIDNGGKIQVMVYATETGKLLNVELEQASTGIPNQVLKMPVTAANEWVTLTFDFGATGAIPAGTEFKQLVFRYHDSADGTGEVLYIDNVTQTN